MRFFLFLFFGIFVGLYLSWPGLVIPENWKCFNDNISKSTVDKISLRAAFGDFLHFFVKEKEQKDVFRNKNRRRFLFSLICLRMKFNPK